MAIAEPLHTSPHASIDCLRRVRHQQRHHPSSTLPTTRPPRPLPLQHSSMLTVLYLPIPYATYNFSSEPHQTAVGSLLQPCKGLSKIASETDYHLLDSPRPVAMAVAPVAATLSHSIKTVDVVNPIIEGTISIHDLAQSKSRLYFRSSPFPSLLHSPFSTHPCPWFNNKYCKSMHAQNCSLDDVRRTRRCQIDRLWLNPDASQERQPVLDFPFDDYQSIQRMMEKVDEEDSVGQDEERYLELVMEERAVALDRPLFLRSRSGIDWRPSSSAIETFDRVNRTKGDPPPPCAHAAVAASDASDVTPDSRTTHTFIVARFKHDNNDSNDESSVFGLGAPSLPSSSLSSVSARPSCCHICTATSTTTVSLLPHASTVTPSSPLPPLSSSSATLLFLDSSSLAVTSSLDVNLRSPSPEQPTRSTIIGEASSSPFSSPSLSSSSSILSPPTSTLLASVSSSSSSPSTTTTTTTTRIFNLNDCEESVEAPTNSVTTSLAALNCSSFTNSPSFPNTIITPAQQLLADSEQFRHYLLREHPGTSSSMGNTNPAGSTPNPLSSSSPSSYSASSAAMSDLSSSSPHSLQELPGQSQISPSHNVEPASESCHHISSRAAAGCDHDRSDSDCRVDLGLADRNGNSTTPHLLPHRHNQRQERDSSSDMASTSEMQLREQIMARISPRATMMSRAPPALPEVSVWGESVAHQIRRVQSAHMAELNRQWEDQQQQRREAQVQEQQSLQQHQRQNSYPPSQRPVSTSRYVPVAMERTSPVVMQRSMPSRAATTEAQQRHDEEMHRRNMARGSNSLYLNYEGGVLRPEEQWRRGQDDMVGR